MLRLMRMSMQMSMLMLILMLRLVSMLMMMLVLMLIVLKRIELDASATCPASAHHLTSPVHSSAKCTHR